MTLIFRVSPDKKHVLPDGRAVAFSNTSGKLWVREEGIPDAYGERDVERSYLDLSDEEYEALRREHPEWRLPEVIEPQEQGTGTGNTIGRVQGQSPAAKVPAEDANPEVTAETPSEGSWWGSASPWVHGALDFAGFAPGLGAFPDLLNAGIYALEGNTEEALWSLAAAVPGPGDIAKGGRLAIKAGEKVVARGAKKATREAEQKIAERALKERAEKEAAERAEKEAAERAEKEAAERAEKEAAERAEKEAAKKPGSKVKKRPCDHLKKGDPNSKGPYRGGSFGGLKEHQNGGTDRNHMPAKSISPMQESQGPAIQMDRADHALTGSHGHAGRYGHAWRENIQRMIDAGDWRGAMVQELLDVRNLSRMLGNPTKYNEAMLQMLKYFRCLETHGLLPGSKNNAPKP